jgi:long-chain acyl-CoA synthetase
VRAVLARGGTLVFQDGMLNPAMMIQTIEREQVNALSAVPAGLAIFSGRLEPLLKRVGPQIEVMELGSAFMSPEQKARLLEIFPRARICMHYGLTEASRSTFLEFRSDASKLQTVGRASPNVRLRILDATGNDCAPGSEGEIVVYGDHVLEQYLGDESRTQAAFTADRGFRTGDYGFLDAAGYLTLLGRKDEMINKGGIKISPLELEDKIREAYPELDFCVVGVADPAGIAGQVPVVAYTGEAKVELKPMLDALAQRVERTKLPDLVVHVESIPRTDNGKPKRRELGELIADKIRSKPS